MGTVAKPKVGRRTPKPLQGDDAPEQLLQTVAAGARPARWPWPERDLAFLATSLLSGLRLSELLSLNVGSIDGRPGERRIKVVGKGRKERTVPIEEPLQHLLDAYLATRRERFPGVKLGPKAPLFVDRRGDRLKRGGAHYLVEKSYQAAGLGSRVPAGAMVHALRHTFATRLAEDGASATEIQALLGHEVAEHVAGIHRRHRQPDPPGRPGQPHLPDPPTAHPLNHRAVSGTNDPAQITELLRRLAAGDEVFIPGPLALDIRGSHEWVTSVSIERAAHGVMLSWHGGHHHVNPISGPLDMDGDALHVPTEDHGVVVLRPIGPPDTWPVFPGNLTAWEASQQAGD